MAEMTRSKLGNSYPRAEVEATHQENLAELRSMYRKMKCEDCGNGVPNWASLKRAVFICINCAQKLRADASNKVKNCVGTYLWHPDEMQVMRTRHAAPTAPTPPVPSSATAKIAATTAPATSDWLMDDW